MNPLIWEFEAIGTQWKITVFNEVMGNQTYNEEKFAKIKIKVANRIEEFDKNYSRFRADSLVTHMSQIAGEFELPADAEPLFSLYYKMFQITKGLVTPLIGQVLVDAGYDAKYSFIQKPMTVPKPWDEVLTYEFPQLAISEPILLDLGAAGKGYLVDIVGELFEKEGIVSYVINAGGDIRHRSAFKNEKNLDESSEKFRVGLEDPQHFDLAIGVVEIYNQSICGSAGNRRRWGNMHHIINPEKLSSPEDILAVWVIADSTLLSDMLTTALYFVTTETLVKHFSFEYCLLRSDYTIESSDGFTGDLFTK